MYYKDIFLTGPQAAIGYEDENLPTRVIIDISDLTKYGTGTTVLEVKRPCDREAYIAEQTEVDGDNIYWYPTKGDLEVSGLLKCQVKAVIGDQIVKTRVYFVQVSGALNGDGTLSGVVPDALQTFVESVSGSEAAAKASAEEAKKAEEAAKASETAAKASGGNAASSAASASDSAERAASSASEARASADSVKASADTIQTNSDDIGNLKNQINSEAATRASADSNLQSQINQIIAPSGEAPSAAEVQNARIGVDGVTYDTLGTAIRTQVSELKGDFGKQRKIIGFKNILNPEEIKMDYGIPAVVINATPINASPSSIAHVAITGIMRVYPGDTVNIRMLHTMFGRIMLAKKADGAVTRAERTVEGQTDYSIVIKSDENFLRLQMRASSGDVADARNFAMVAVNTPLEKDYISFGSVSINGDIDIQKLKNDMQSPWNGKICACLGTSLTANGGWTDVLKERFEFSKVYNRGSGGTTLANYSQDGFSDYVTSCVIYDDESVWGEERNTCYYTSSDVPSGYENYSHTKKVQAWYSSESRVNTLPTDADLVIIDIGTNDWFRIRTGLGWTDRLNTPQINTPYRQKENPPTYDDKKMGDAFVLLVQRIKVRCPNAKIVVWGMMYNSTICTYNAATSEPSEDMDTWLQMIRYVDVLCEKFGIYYIDVAHEAGINVFNLEEYCEDGIHPYKPTYNTEKGKYAVANVLTQHLRQIFPKDYDVNQIN